MELKEPIKKRFQDFRMRARLPVIVRSEGSLMPEAWLLYTGLFNGRSVVVSDPEEMTALYTMGYFGKGSLSRSFPGFGKYKKGIPPLIKERQWKRRQEWVQRILENAKAEEPMDVDRGETSMKGTEEKASTVESGGDPKVEESHGKQNEAATMEVQDIEPTIKENENKNECRQDVLSENDVMNIKVKEVSRNEEESESAEIVEIQKKEKTPHEATVESGQSEPETSEATEESKQLEVSPDVGIVTESVDAKTNNGEEKTNKRNVEDKCISLESDVTSTDTGGENVKTDDNGENNEKKDSVKEVDIATSRMDSEKISLDIDTDCIIIQDSDRHRNNNRDTVDACVPSCSSHSPAQKEPEKEDLSKGSQDLEIVTEITRNTKTQGSIQDKDCMVISEDEDAPRREADVADISGEPEIICLSETEEPCPSKRRKLQEAMETVKRSILTGDVQVVPADSDSSQDQHTFTRRKSQKPAAEPNKEAKLADIITVALDSDCSQEGSVTIRQKTREETKKGVVSRGEIAVVLDSDCSQDQDSALKMQKEETLGDVRRETRSGHQLTLTLDSDCDKALEAISRSQTELQVTLTEDCDEVMVAEDDWSDAEEHPVVSIQYEPVKTVTEQLALTLEEAFFLSYGLGCLEVLDAEGEPLSLLDMWSAYRRAQEDFVEKYVAYHYFRAKGWVVKPGLKFGGDFLLYKKGPPHYHASYVVLVDVLNSSYRRSADNNRRRFNWAYQMGLDRMCESTNKEVLFCQIRWPETTEDEMNSPQVLRKFRVSEKLMRRWRPSQQREID